MGKVNWKIVAGGVAIFVLGIAVASVGPLTSVRPQMTFAQPALYDEGTVMSIYDKSTPAIVEIDVAQASLRGRVIGEGQGSGFLINTDGTILTNNHVVEGASKILVVFNNGKTVSANVVGTDSIHDLALIKVDPSAVSGVTPLTLADSNTVKPGQMAIAMGFPFGLDESITVGVISGLNRTVSGSRLTGMLQTDAALNPGNSGGPLLNANGEVIGINTAIETQAGAEGIGFAIPSNVARRALPALSTGKSLQRPWMGISYLALNADLARQLNISVDRGIYIVNVIPESPAEKAGLKGSGVSQNRTPSPGGDVITAVDGHSVKSIFDLLTYVSDKQVGDPVTLSVLRAGSSTELTLTLGARPSAN
ncbi:MAG: trypsin-like peptidase domain-containing protein [Dehalococcoidales bacterium]|nr:trypsin-like peptidase domain-containing protein [Dehalococcoidales bacterium]